MNWVISFLVSVSSLCFVPQHTLAPAPMNVPLLVAGVVGHSSINHSATTDENQAMVRSAGFDGFNVSVEGLRATVELFVQSHPISGGAPEEFAEEFTVLENEKGEIIKIEPILSDKLQWRKRYYLKNAERIKEKVHEYYLENKEHINEMARAYYQKNKERSQIYYQEHKEQIKANRKVNKEKIRDRGKIFYEKHKEEIKEKQAVYNLEHRTELQAYQKEYYLKNKAKIAEIRSLKRQKLKLSGERTPSIRGAYNPRSESMEPISPEESPLMNVQSNELYHLIWETIEQMNPLSQEISKLILDDVSDENIAGALKLSIRKVKIVRAKLQRTLAPFENLPPLSGGAPIDKKHRYDFAHLFNKLTDRMNIQPTPEQANYYMLVASCFASVVLMVVALQNRPNVFLGWFLLATVMAGIVILMLDMKKG